MTLHDRFCRGLEAMGFTPFHSRNMYTMYMRQETERTPVRYVFVGKAGALRVNSRPNAATSRDCGDSVKAMVLDAYVANA